MIQKQKKKIKHKEILKKSIQFNSDARLQEI